MVLISKTGRVLLNGRLVGFVSEVGGELVFTSPRTTRHFFRKFKGYGFSLAVLDSVSDLGVKIVRVKVLDQRKMLAASIETVKTKGIPYVWRGDKQYILPETFFTEISF